MVYVCVLKFDSIDSNFLFLGSVSLSLSQRYLASFKLEKFLTEICILLKSHVQFTPCFLSFSNKEDEEKQRRNKHCFHTKNVTSVVDMMGLKVCYGSLIGFGPIIINQGP